MILRLYLIIIPHTYNQLSAPFQNAQFNWLNAVHHFWRAPSVGHVTGQEPIRDLAEVLTMQGGFWKSSDNVFLPKSLSKSLPLIPLKPARLYRFPSLCLSLFTIKSTDSCKYLVANSFQRRKMWMFFSGCVCMRVS